ncbi:MAG: carboxypeptidase regulatory-like domain-containing protein [Euryarchaeota archaeon]|nr:carboxypeptidase regulatory-like domain-containing protein [Euryarchaeota archaeon]
MSTGTQTVNLMSFDLRKDTDEEPEASTEGAARPDERPAQSRASPAGESLGKRLGRKVKIGLRPEQWNTIVALVFIFLLAVFIRSYFGIAPESENGFLLSGGSDSYYYHWTIRYTYETGNYLHRDGMLSYPLSGVNPRPPMYPFTTVIAGYMLTPFFGGDYVVAIWWSFLFSTAIAGALTIFPTYLIGKESFGKKAGLIGAFLLALSPGHLQRSVLSDADHDALALLMIMMGFYFLLRALKLLGERDYVPSWGKPREALGGIRDFFKENRSSVLYSMMGGFCFLAVMFTWTGFIYAYVILTAYLLVQVLMNRLRNREILGLMVIYTMIFALPLLLAFPYYHIAGLVAGWWDLPGYIYLGTTGIAAILMLTRKYPWTLVLASMALLAVIAVAAIFVASPTLYGSLVDKIASASGYFITSKQYETIAEAQAPPFSNLATSFGLITFWLSIAGLGLGLYQLPKKLKPDFIFIILLMIFSIYMAVISARFMFNAAPGFAIMAGWVIAMLLDKLDLKGEISRQSRFRGATIFGTSGIMVALLAMGLAIAGAVAGYYYLNNLAPVALGVSAVLVILFMLYTYGLRAKDRYYLAAMIPLLVALALYIAYYSGFKRTVDHAWVPVITAFYLGVLFFIMRETRVRVVAGVLFLAFMVVVPNVWAGLDGGMPYEVKTDYDKRLYQVMPSFTASATYDEVNGSTWYLGGHGYSMPLNNRYWPSAYRWLATQDNGTYPFSERPAFISWWDYGFEVINQGEHPTVADNFLGGHNVAGNFLMAQNESNAISLFCMRLLQGDWYAPLYTEKKDMAFSPGVRDVLVKYNIDPAAVDDAFRNPQNYKAEILAHPEIYGPRDSRVQDENARILKAMAIISMSMNQTQVTGLYHDLRDATGKSIRYFAVDSRLFPFSADNTGIFYAPAKLSDHRIKTPNMPYDFWEIKGVGEYGGEYDINDVPKDVQITDYKLVYHDMFYKTMLYKCFIGYSGPDVGQSNDSGIPGLSGSLQNQPAMPGYMMKNFRIFHRTAYYNPYPMEQVRNHTDAWTAMNYDDAVALQAKIQAGEAEGVVDLSTQSSLYQGVNMLKYYDGAIVQGQIRLRGGPPVEGLRVTVQDMYQIPHDSVLTDSDGRYSLLAPMGNVSIIVSSGEPLKMTMVGTELNNTKMFIRDDQAMREQLDLDGNGIPDYIITHSPVLEPANVSGIVYIDSNGDGNRNPDETTLPGADLDYGALAFNMSYAAKTDSAGNYSIPGMAQGNYRLIVTYNGVNIASEDSVSVTYSNTGFVKNIGTTPVNLSGHVADELNFGIGQALVNITDSQGHNVESAITDGSGNFNVSLVVGNYTYRASSGNYWSIPAPIEVRKLTNSTLNITVYPAAPLTVQATIQGAPAANLSVTFQNLNDPKRSVMLFADGAGKLEDRIPFGFYSVYASREVSGSEFAYLGNLRVTDAVSIDVALQPAGRLNGRLLTGGSFEPSPDAKVQIEGSGTFYTRTNPADRFTALLPYGQYNVTVMNDDLGAIWLGMKQRVSVSAATTTIEVDVGAAQEYGGIIYNDTTRNGAFDEGEGLPGYGQVVDAAGTRDIYTDLSGRFLVKYLGENPTMTAYSPGYASMTYTDETRPMSRNPENAVYWYFDLSPRRISVSGGVRTNDGTTLDGGKVVAERLFSKEVYEMPIIGNAYSGELPPAEYNLTLSFKVSDTVVYELRERSLGLRLGLSEEPVMIDLLAEMRYLVNVSAAMAGQQHITNYTFTGEESLSLSALGETVISLKGGNYTATAVAGTNGTVVTGYERFFVPTAGNVTVALNESSLVTGSVDFQGAKMKNVPVSAIEAKTGATFSAVTDNETGDFKLYLPTRQTYNFTSDFKQNSTDGSVEREYHYKGVTNNVTASVGSQFVPVRAQRDIVNASVKGAVGGLAAPASAALQLFASGGGGISSQANLSANGSFQTELAPGSYVAYLASPDERAGLLRAFNLTREGTELALAATEAFKLSGNLYYGAGTPADNASISIKFLGVERKLSADSLGYFETWLPQATYEVAATLDVLEGGITVPYSMSSTAEMSRSTRLSSELSKEKTYGVEIVWDTAQKRTFVQGSEAIYTFDVNNKGNVPDTYTLSTSQEPTWDVKLNLSQISLGSGESMPVRAVITIPADAKTDHTPINVLARSKLIGSTASITKTLDVPIYHNYTVSTFLSPSPPTVSGSNVSFGVSMTNGGNGPDNCSVTCLNEEELARFGWTFSWEPSVGWTINNTTATVAQMKGGEFKEVRFTLKKARADAEPGVVVKLVGKSLDDPDGARSLLDVSVPLMSADVQMVEVKGDLVTAQTPWDAQLQGIGTAAIVVAIVLVLYYIAKRRRWVG